MSDTTAGLLAAADQCVKCALCLPHCPTYQHYSDENESPRGRIALAEALLQGQIAMDERIRQHLDHCLTCQRCETACPSRVPYTRLLRGIRQRWPARAHWARTLLQRPAWLTRATMLAHRLPSWQHWPLPIRLARALGPQKPLPACGTYPPADATQTRRLGLLLGCATRATQANALRASIRLLNALGYTLIIPPHQSCCGALAAHQGAQQQADACVQHNRTAFADSGATIISIASGCAAGSPLALMDIVVFLAQHQAALRQLPWRPLDYRVVLHQPCTSRACQAVPELLAHIRGLQVQSLTDGCCGAAGDHLIRQRHQAVALRQPVLAQIPDMATHLVTTNVGCALHLAEGLQQSGRAICVRHPVELLAESLMTD